MQLLDVIKFEGDDNLVVWKHPNEDFNTKSVLIVHESQEAIFFKDGKALDLFGPGKYELETENIPLLRAIINIPTMGVSPFHCEVYFINKATSMNMEWGTNSRFQVLDPHFGVPLNVGASGSMEFIIEDARKFGCIIRGNDIVLPAGLKVKITINHGNDPTLFYVERNGAEFPFTYMDDNDEIDVTFTEFGQKLYAYANGIYTTINAAYDQLRFIEQVFGVKIINV